MANVPKSVRNIIEAILKAEGGYVDDPADRGGKTNYGITEATLGHWRKLGRNANEAEVRGLTKAEATEIYLKQYYYRPSFDELYKSLQPTVTDFGVNSGTSRATKILQDMCNQIEGESLLKVDGMLGHHSIGLINEWCKRYPVLFVSSFCYKRIKYYIDITNKRPANKRFIRGWIVRTNKFLKKEHKFDLTLIDNYVK
ncbi:MAG: N-acetylmuramidase [Gammaproteobacteria bacterium]|nr:N-acetylmuramidase [Gammaproteobacteria bacterium]